MTEKTLSFRAWLLWSIEQARFNHDALDPKAAEILTNVLEQFDARDLATALEAENFRLAAGQCVVENGLVGDDHGHFGCSLQARLSLAERQRAELVEALREAREQFRREMDALVRCAEASPHHTPGSRNAVAAMRDAAIRSFDALTNIDQSTEEDRHG